MASQEGWLWIVSKGVARVGMNMVVPGSSVLIDACEIAGNFYRGEVISGSIGITLALTDIVTLGIGSAVKLVQLKMPHFRLRTWQRMKRSKK